jgi:hypothetical protein
MDKWQKYLTEARKKKKRTFGDDLQSDMDDFLKKGSKKAAKGSPFRGSSYNFRGKTKNQVSSPPGAAGGGALEEEVEEETFEMNATLQPTIWRDMELNPRVSEKLLAIAEDFLEGLEIDVDMLDLRITGSLANFNWSKYSDVDLHIVVDFAAVDEDLTLVKAYFDAARAKWNDLHDITIKGHEVEIYVENANEEHVSSGIYSILGQKWIIEPAQREVDIDFAQARKKSDSIQTRVAMIGYQVEAEDYRGALKSIDRIKSKIRRMRAAGLASPQREFSPENIAFKILRREEILKQLNDLKYNAYDNMMSLKEGRRRAIRRDN